MQDEKETMRVGAALLLAEFASHLTYLPNPTPCRGSAWEVLVVAQVTLSRK